MTGPLPRLLFVILLLLPAAGLKAQPADEPVGWPLRTGKTTPFVPKPVPLEQSGATDSQAAPTDPGAAPDATADAPTTAGSPSAINATLAPIDRFTLPIRPLDFRFDGDRTALSRAEANELSRLAQRLRASSDHLRITAYTDATGRSAEEALRLSLTRALTVRELLVREGIAVERIDLTALPHGSGSDLAGEGRVHIEKAPTQNAAAPD